ncbi:hypothetical protein GGI35DRAFT_427790 [Trichoderma velutinum]
MGCFALRGSVFVVLSLPGSPLCYNVKSSRWPKLGSGRYNRALSNSGARDSRSSVAVIHLPPTPCLLVPLVNYSSPTSPTSILTQDVSRDIIVQDKSFCPNRIVSLKGMDFLRIQDNCRAATEQHVRLDSVYDHPEIFGRVDGYFSVCERDFGLGTTPVVTSFKTARVFVCMSL